MKKLSKYIYPILAATLAFGVVHGAGSAFVSHPVSVFGLPRIPDMAPKYARNVDRHTTSADYKDRRHTSVEDENRLSPFPLRVDVSTTVKAKSISILFAGDLMQHLPQVRAAESDSTGYDYKGCFEHIAPLFQSSDLAVINLETTLSDAPPYSGYPAFVSPSKLAADIKRAGVDVALLANNHICDNGGSGIYNTIRALDGAGILHTGAFIDSAGFAAGNPLTIHRNGFRISILNYTYGTNGIPTPKGRMVNRIDTAVMARDMALIKPSADNLTFVCLHWGHEYHTSQSREQEALAQWLRSKGVDFIIGGHPHVIQPAIAHSDTISGAITGITVYSLGNFVSNQQSPNTDGGMVVRLNITRNPGRKAEVKPANMFVWTYKPVIDGRKRYYVLPPAVASNLLQKDSTELRSYNKFITNARKIMGAESGFTEAVEI